MMSPASTSARPTASRCRRAMAAISNRSTARRASSWPRAMAARAGSPNTMCWPGCRRARSAGSPILLRGSPRAGSSADCRCGYDTISLYPAFGAFMSARSFQVTTGIQHFYDAHDLGAKDVEPDSFFYDKALKLMSQETPHTPLFMFVYLAANHFPWETRFRPDLMPSWRKQGNEPVVVEYLRRHA